MLTVVPTRADAIRAFERGQVEGVAGNHLTMRFLMGQLAADAVEVPLISRPYHMAVLPGRENVVAPLRAALDRLKATGEFDRLVEQYLTNPVRRSWIERYAAALSIAGGLIVLLFVGGTAWNRSLHQQVRARTKAVERTERRYRDLVENANDMIYRTDPFGRFTFVNPVATRILGYEEGELLAMKYFELMRPDWVPRAMAFYEQSAKSRESTYLEFPVRKKDGSEIWVGQQVRPIVTGGRIEGFQGMARDITERVSAQAELRSERDFVSAILETAPSLVMVLDSQGRVVRFNRACEALSGTTLEHVQGRPIWELPFLLEENRPDVQEGIPRLLESTVPVTLDRTWVGADGGRHVIEWTVMSLRDPVGETRFLVGIGSDVTLARELERLKSQFVSMVSHELRTPLTSIRASMQLLIAEAMTGNEDADQLVRVALSNADRLIRIVNDILDMSKIEAGEMMVMPRRVVARAHHRRLGAIDRRAVARRGGHDRAPAGRAARRDGRSGSHDPGAREPAVECRQALGVRRQSGRVGRPRRLDGGRDHPRSRPRHSRAQGGLHLRAVHAARRQRHAPDRRHRARPDDRPRAGGEAGRHHPRLIARRTGRHIYADVAARRAGGLTEP